MTDLEDAWDRYPTPVAPVADIVREGRRSQRTRVARPVLGGLVAAGLVAGLVVTLNSGGGNNTPSTAAAGTAEVPIQMAAFEADLKPTSCDQLLKTFRQRGLKDVNAYGWSGSGIVPLGTQIDQGTMLFRANDKIGRASCRERV